MAWLNAVPQPDERSRRARQGVEKSTLSRLDRMKRDRVVPVMPPNPAPILVGHLIEMGMAEAVGMGVGPLNWATIDAWQRLTGAVLEPWEARLIRRLSVEYAAEGRRAEAETCPPPWRAPVTAREIEIERAGLAAFLS